MHGSFTSNTYNVTGLLGRASFPNDSAKTISVPSFQRGYSWEKSHVATFWEDIITFHKQIGKQEAQENYFFGPIVILPGGPQISLLDGQQRLATITILLAVIRNIARTKGQVGSDLARDIHRDLIMVDDDADIYALTLSELDAPFFRSFVQEDPPDESASLRLRSHYLIKQAKGFFQSEVEKLIDGLDARNQVITLKSLQRTVASQLKLVAIEVRSEEEAFLIFETLNDRGLRLAVPDLVLNHLMRIASNKMERNQVREYWNQIIENLSQQKVSTFVRHMWVSRYGDVKTQGLFREIRTNLESQSISPLEFARLCAKESEEYIAITDLNKNRLGEHAYRYVEALVKYLSAERSLPLLLSGLICLDISDFESLARALVTVTVRHSILANLNPSNLEDALYRAARILRAKKEQGGSSKLCLFEAKQILSEINPSREQVTTGIMETILTQNQAKYIVYALAEHRQASDGSVKLGDNSLEHIFPANAEANVWSKLSEIEPYIWHIGNLTVLEPKLNRRAKNSSFADKIQIYIESNITLTKTICENYSEWGVNQILSRAKSLLPIIRDIWKESL